jgi:transposase
MILSDRTWICPDCHTEHDRDVNASVNIRDIGINQNGVRSTLACGFNLQEYVRESSNALPNT